MTPPTPAQPSPALARIDGKGSLRASYWIKSPDKRDRFLELRQPQFLPLTSVYPVPFVISLGPSGSRVLSTYCVPPTGQVIPSLCPLVRPSAKRDWRSQRLARGLSVSSWWRQLEFYQIPELLPASPYAQIPFWVLEGLGTPGWVWPVCLGRLHSSRE